MTDIYFCRHGEAEGNLYRRCHGHYNSLLTPNGEAQARAASRVFASKKLDAVYCSDLYRARRTAELVIDKRMTPIPLPAWREEHLGGWEDLPWGEIQYSDAENYRVFSCEPGKFAPPGFESVAACADRLFRAFKEAVQRHNGGSILIVSHGMALRALLTLLDHKPLSHMSFQHMDNTAISHVRWDGQTSEVVSYGDNSHLGELSTLARQNWWKKNENKDMNLRFIAIRPLEEPSLIARFGSEALSRAALLPHGVFAALDGQTPVGLIILGAIGRQRESSGHIAFMRLLPTYAWHGLEPQLLGAAVSYYRGNGCRQLSIQVAQQDSQALAFYKRMGFARRPDGNGGYILRKNIAAPETSL